MTEQTAVWTPPPSPITTDQKVELMCAIIISGEESGEWMQMLQNAVYAVKGVKG